MKNYWDFFSKSIFYIFHAAYKMRTPFLKAGKLGTPEKVLDILLIITHGQLPSMILVLVNLLCK